MSDNEEFFREHVAGDLRVKRLVAAAESAKSALVVPENGVHYCRSYFELEVCGVTYLADGTKAIVELHLPRSPALSISEWEERFKRRLRGS